VFKKEFVIFVAKKLIASWLYQYIKRLRRNLIQDNGQGSLLFSSLEIIIKHNLFGANHSYI